MSNYWVGFCWSLLRHTIFLLRHDIFSFYALNSGCFNLENLSSVIVISPPGSFTVFVYAPGVFIGSVWVFRFTFLSFLYSHLNGSSNSFARYFIHFSSGSSCGTSPPFLEGGSSLGTSLSLSFRMVLHAVPHFLLLPEVAPRLVPHSFLLFFWTVPSSSLKTVYWGTVLTHLCVRRCHHLLSSRMRNSILRTGDK